jgi:outer membrane biosynthesis protein TonB
MGAPGSGIKAGDQPAAETLLTAFKKIDASERRRHASVLNYWLSIRGDKEFPPLHDLDPLELSDAGPSSILLELISGGHDAEIRHMGEALRDGDWPERIMDAEGPSILTCIAKKLPIVAISRDFLAFEDEFEGENGPTRCWVTLLPLSAGGAWVDYVYAFATVEPEKAKTAKPAKSAKKAEAAVVEEAIEEPAAEEVVDDSIAEVEEPEVAEDLVEETAEDAPEPEAEEPAAELDEPVADEIEDAPADEYIEEEIDEPAPKAAPGFSKLLDSLAGLTGFYGSQPVKVDPVVYEPEEEPVAEELAEEPEEFVADEPVAEEAVEEAPAEEIEEPVAEAAPPAPAESPKKTSEQPTRASEGSLKDKLADVRAKADEAREAKLRANVALYEGLSAAYDFALDAEEAPEDYLRLVEAQGLKIQLRSPMKPVVKLAFDGMCDDATIKQLEAVLAWAFDQELPRGTLVDQIEAAGGIGTILQAKAA